MNLKKENKNLNQKLIKIVFLHLLCLKMNDFFTPYERLGFNDSKMKIIYHYLTKKKKIV